MKTSNTDILIGLPTIKNLNILKQDWPMRHSVNIDYKCIDCGRTFDDFKMLESHREAVHADSKTKICKQCLATFES